MSVDKAKESPVKNTTSEKKVVEAKTESSATGDQPATSTKTETKPDASSKKQGMGEGQKAVSKAYKDNWNDIFAKKRKR